MAMIPISIELYKKLVKGYKSSNKWMTLKVLIIINYFKYPQN